MNRYGKKAVSMLLLLVMLCTITAMAAAEGEENTSGSEASTVITPDSGSTEAPTAGTSSTTPSENTGTAEATSGTEQVVIVLPDGPAAEDKKESADSATVSETGPGGATECCAAAGEHRASDGYQASDG